MDRAAEHLEAALEPHRPHGVSRLKHLADNALRVAAGELPVLHDLVVRRKDTGAVVLRTKADVGSPEYLLAQVRDDLETKTIEEFFAEWR